VVSTEIISLAKPETGQEATPLRIC